MLLLHNTVYPDFNFLTCSASPARRSPRSSSPQKTSPAREVSPDKRSNERSPSPRRSLSPRSPALQKASPSKEMSPERRSNERSPSPGSPAPLRKVDAASRSQSPYAAVGYKNTVFQMCITNET